MQISSHNQVIGKLQTRSRSKQAEYSLNARQVAEKAVKFHDSNRGDWQKISENAVDSFDVIKNDRWATVTEKDLADFGLRLQSYQQFSPKTRARMMRPLLGSIAAAVPGPMGQVLAQAGLQVLNYAASDSLYGRYAAKEALRAVVTSSGCGQREKDLAAVGVELALEVPQRVEAIRIQRSVLTRLANGLGPEPMPQMIAQVTEEALSILELTSRERQNVAALRGLQEIHHHPDCTLRDRALAQMGTVLGEKLDVEDGFRVRQNFLREIMIEREDSAPTALAKVAVSVSELPVARGTKREVLEEIFVEILANSESTPRQRHQASQGLQSHTFKEKLAQMQDISKA